LVVVQGFYLLLALGQDQPGNWTRALEPARTLFLRPQRWHTQRVLFQRGTQVVVVQRLQPSSFRPWYARTAKLTPVLPGLQWAESLPGEGVLDASWRFVDTLHHDRYSLVAVRLSRDSAVHRWRRPWWQARQQAGQRHQRALFRQRVGPQHPDSVEHLPAATQQGANTLGCVLTAAGPATQEGLRLRPTVRQGYACRATFEPGSTDSYRPANTLSVEAELLVQGIPHDFRFQLTGVQGVGTYPLPGCWAQDRWRTMQLFDPWNYAHYCSGACPPAVVTITYWSAQQRIVSGFFEGTLQTGARGQQVVRVSEGRFDLRYEVSNDRESPNK
jgi:hypothetical protein